MTLRVSSLTVSYSVINILYIESGRSNMSKQSLRSQVQAAVEREGKHDWDPSVKSDKKMSTEDRVAARLA